MPEKLKEQIESGKITIVPAWTFAQERDIKKGMKIFFRIVSEFINKKYKHFNA